MSSKEWSLRTVADFGPEKTDTRVFRIVRENYGRMESTTLTQADEYLVIHGDLCPGKHGVVSPIGYTLDWFARATSPHYLGEKFLQKGWHKELAEKWVAEQLAMSLSEWADYGLEFDQRDKLKELCLDDMGDRMFYDALYEIESSWVEEDLPGYDYDPQDMRVLCAIQQRFAVLWAARTPGEQS
jgi:hypothetical protein